MQQSLGAPAEKRVTPIDVLIVDDDVNARTMYSMYLMNLGCKVRTARDGRSAIAQANQRTPDVIVMDMMMPRLDGWAASKTLKVSPATSHVPIIALTGAEEAREHARAAGCDAFLAKPCTPDLLWWEIRALLNPLV